MRHVLTITLAGLLAAAAPAEDSARGDSDRFLGAWRVVSIRVDGRDLPAGETAAEMRVVYGEDGSWRQTAEGDSVHEGVVSALDAGAKHRAIDYRVTRGQGAGKVVRARYEFVDADTYRVCYGAPDADRPVELSSAPGSGLTLCVLKRVKK